VLENFKWRNRYAAGSKQKTCIESLVVIHRQGIVPKKWLRRSVSKRETREGKIGAKSQKVNGRTLGGANLYLLRPHRHRLCVGLQLMSLFEPMLLQKLPYPPYQCHQKRCEGSHHWISLLRRECADLAVDSRGKRHQYDHPERAHHRFYRRCKR
jgi:hypothetical protein